MKIKINNGMRLGWRLVWSSALLASMPALVGCHKQGGDQAASHQSELLYGDEFPRDDEPRQFHRVMDAQAAVGARADGMLHACHFDTGGTPTGLNSLGEEKLELMLIADASLPLVVYLDVPKDDSYAGREQAVKVFLKDRGLIEGQVTLVQGPNLHNTNSAAGRLKAVEAIEGGASAGSAPHGAAATGGGMAGK